MSMLAGDEDEYKIKRRESKIVAIVRNQGTQELYDELDTKEGKKRYHKR